MNRFAYLFAGLAAAFSLILASASAIAQGTTAEADEETSVVLGLNDYHEFHITVTNNGFGAMSFHVERTRNELPAEGWQSAVCMAELCYSNEVNITDVVTIEAGQTYKVKLNVFSGETEDAVGRFTLKFVADGLGGGEFGSIDFTVTAKSSASVPVIVEAAQLPRPNPAVAAVTIPLNAVADARQVEVFSVSGARVASFDGAALAGDDLRVNLADFAAGLYYYTVRGSEEMRSGSFTVVK